MKIQGDKLNPTRYSKSQIKWFAILIPLAIFYVLPIIFIFSTAFKPLSELFEYPPKLFARNPTTENFEDLVSVLSGSTIPFSRYLMNSILTTLIVTAANVLISLYAAYTIAKKKFRGKELLSTIEHVQFFLCGYTMRHFLP